jgi:hypothetical protein
VHCEQLIASLSKLQGNKEACELTHFVVALTRWARLPLTVDSCFVIDGSEGRDAVPCSERGQTVALEPRTVPLSSQCRSPKKSINPFSLLS